MMKYQINGAHKHNGESVSVTCSASSPDEATKQANQKGILVNGQPIPIGYVSDPAPPANPPQTEQITDQSERNLRYQNSVERVVFLGGIIGALSSNPKSRLQKTFDQANYHGWRVRQIIPDPDQNLFQFLIRAFLLIITLFLYTERQGFYIVYERDVSD